MRGETSKKPEPGKEDKETPKTGADTKFLFAMSILCIISFTQERITSLAILMTVWFMGFSMFMVHIAEVVAERVRMGS